MTGQSQTNKLRSQQSNYSQGHSGAHSGVIQQHHINLISLNHQIQQNSNDQSLGYQDYVYGSGAGMHVEPDEVSCILPVETNECFFHESPRGQTKSLSQN